MPAPLRIGARVRDASLADLAGKHGAKSGPPKANGLMADVDPALGQELLDVAERERISNVHHHDQTDDLRRAVEISERIAHGLKLPRRDALRALCLTTPSGSRHGAAAAWRIGLRSRLRLSPTKSVKRNARWEVPGVVDLR